MRYKIASGSARREDTLFAIQRIYGSSFYARPYVFPGQKSQLSEVAKVLGIEVNEEVIKSLYSDFRKSVRQRLDANRVTGRAKYVFKKDSDGRITLPNGFRTGKIKAGDKIEYIPGSYLRRIYYRMQDEGEFTIFIGSGGSDISALQEGMNLAGAKSQRFVTYSATVDQALPNRKSYVVDKDRRVFMPYKSGEGGPRWVTLKAGTVVNPPENRPVNTLEIWNEVVDRYKDKIVTVNNLPGKK